MPRPAKARSLDQAPAPHAVTFDRTRKASEQIYEWLRDSILRLEYPPGSTLSEVELGGLTGLSRTPVREALKRLEMEGLVMTYPSLGTVVSRISINQIEQSVVMRALLEGEAAARAAARPDRLAIADAMGAIVLIQTAALEAADVAGVYRADERFHETLFTMIGMDLMWTTVRMARTGMRRLRELTIQDPVNRAVARNHHAEVVEAIRAGRADDARAIMTEHVNSNWSFLERVREINPDYIENDRPLLPGTGRV